MGQPEEKVVKMHLAPVVRGRRGFPALTSAGKAVRARGARGDGGAGGHEATATLHGCGGTAWCWRRAGGAGPLPARAGRGVLVLWRSLKSTLVTKGKLCTRCCSCPNTYR